MATQEKSDLSELISLLFVSGRVMRAKMYRKAKDMQCNSLLQFETLRYIKDNDKPLMRDIARQFSITPPAATLLVDGLVKDKLLVRESDTNDRRAVKLILTAHGKGFFERNMTDKVRELKKMLSPLTPQERKQFIAILKKITKNNV